ncbi:MAG TPA: hypothetical protein VMF59_13980, partial [Bacteroidota bacterium]|nr:hypothetical protein [Bacteroidota bacterium]
MSILLLHAFGSGTGDVPGLIRSGDEAFARIDYPAAIAQYEEARAGRPPDPDLLWRLARACVCSAEVAEGDERRSLLSRGESYARLCIAADSMRAEGHTWLAGALGYI